MNLTDIFFLKASTSPARTVTTVIINITIIFHCHDNPYHDHHHYYYNEVKLNKRLRESVRN